MMGFSHPPKMRKFLTPGSVWMRINHQWPSQVNGERIAEKGEPVQVQVHKVTKEGVEFEIVSKPRTISFLTWPDSRISRVTAEPDKITIENRYGVILTYT